jgi:hypothetical protein
LAQDEGLICRRICLDVPFGIVEAGLGSLRLAGEHQRRGVNYAQSRPRAHHCIRELI